jgi:2-dehydro-3-deoxygalactonokinase
MRAILCRAGSPADRPEVLGGPGISTASGSFEDALFGTIRPWTSEWGCLPVVMSGMVGSNIGWQVVPYVESPAPIREIRRRCKSFEARGHRLSIVPGVSCRNALGEPDLMRGEELQILGWYESGAEAAAGEHILCLPGTHTKWVRFVDGVVETFMTALTGELYAVLCRHSILVPPAGRAEPGAFDEPAFRDGLALARRSGGDLLYTLFSVRSRQIETPERGEDPASYLSGLIVGADVIAGLERFRPWSGTVELIGDVALCRKFAIALEGLGLATNITDGIDAAYAGFRSFGGVLQ